MRSIIIIFVLFISISVLGQKAEIYGNVFDENGKVFDPAVNIALKGIAGGTTTDRKGNYKLNIPANSEIIVQFSHVTHKSKYKTLNLKVGESIQLNIILDELIQFDTVNITAKRHEYTGVTHIDPKEIEAIPSPSGDVISAFVKQIPGVYSNNEMSSQYSVRGGNFDENLVYVNGIEIQRPMLVKSGQQEGMNFANADLVDNIEFSAGGFSSYYGDKMSSVMDVTYKRPTKFGGSASASLLGGSVHLEGSAAKNRLRYLTGIRYKTNQYILSALDTKGDYHPSFTDIQLFVAYDITDDWELSFLGNYAVNNYEIIPQTRETNFGTIMEALRFTVYFDGKEVDRFVNYMGALNLKYHNNETNLDFTGSVYRSIESETYDIQGQYWLDVLQNDLGKDDFGDVAFNKGVGTYLNHARNELNTWVASIQHRGSKGSLQWGFNLRRDILNDRLSEWKMIDSAGFSLPHPDDNIGNANPNYSPSNEIHLTEVIKGKQNLNTNRFSTYLMNDWVFQKNGSTSIYKLNAGARLNYWDFSNELLFSPRISLLIKPAKNKDISYRIATGLYSQPPFYREMRYHNGDINHNIKAQKSAHFVMGTDYVFQAWNRPFKLTAEAYAKYMWDLIPYEMEDVRLRYFAENNAIGYAAGVDFKLHGEIVEHADSWVGVSFMQTQEDIKDDYYYEYYNAAGEKISSGITVDNVPADSVKVEPGFIPRPTDQRFVFNLFFQDYIPGYEKFKVHLNLVYATGLPYGPPTHKRYQQTRRMPAYRRVDIGFSWQLIGHETVLKAKNPLRNLKSAWLSIEVFNLLEINNTLSYMWISDVNGNYYSIPNYLTSRQINLRLKVDF
ncbi:MAG: TonB-dependent receptor [Bacteroidetes bacterium]|nr:MAG: TonB-dependent receptor [Bacteroidota bacterium]